MRKKSGMDWGRMLGHLSPYNIKKAFLYLKHFGWKGFLAKLADRFEYTDISYEEWRKEHAATQEELKRQRRMSETSSGTGVTFSIAVPLYRTPEPFLRRMIESVTAQTYGNWELCLADASPCKKNGSLEYETELTKIVREYQKQDRRISYRVLKENGGISENTNKAFEMAAGEFLCLLDHDDFLEPDALFEFVEALKKHPEAEMIYSDEDKVSADEKEYFQPHLKPDFNIDLLRSNNYICHFLAVKKTLEESVGGLDASYDGAQDYDFIFRCAEKAGQIVHVPRVLYHWRVHSESTADNPFSKEYAYEAGQRAIDAHLKRCGVLGRAVRLKDAGFYRVKYELSGMPKVSLVIPNKDHADDLKACVESVWEKTSYPNYEIIVVENNSEEEATFAYYRELKKQAEQRGKELRLLRWKEKGFSYPAINNYGAAAAKGEYLVLLNNDITVIAPDWLEEFLSVCSRPEVGAVGARLYYPDDTIQHAGIVVGIGGVAGSMFVGLPRERSGYFHKAALMQDLSAVTAACMMVKKKVYEELGGMEEQLPVAFNDVDFCLRIREKGLLVVYDPYVEMYHCESRSRGAEDTKEKLRRFQGEIEFMRRRWIKVLKEGDPYYNPNFSLKTWNYELKH
ncbi:MAG: glycosyltransferase family 2 protein [Eubacteriales bacterium]|nr:glycosyltransferase family 2 protein [Eubacteriales bacterium]